MWTTRATGASALPWKLGGRKQGALLGHVVQTQDTLIRGPAAREGAVRGRGGPGLGRGSHWSVPGRPSRAVSALTSPPGDPSLPPEGGILTEGLNESFVWTLYHDESDPGVWGGADLFRQNL